MARASGDRAHRPLQLAAGLVATEAAAALAIAGFELSAVDRDRLAFGLTTGLFFIAYALGLGACAWGLYRRQRWSRAPVVLAQLIQLGVAWSFADGSTVPVALLLAGVAAAVLVAVLLPSSTAAFTDER